ncbi:hypothetical protein [Streptomyces yaizuensis]|uniref:DUF4280 domain-containing protein n=1 Tax=Streptomyces yaizuensis TaxID=2989713 RepID=A0ABQ5NRX0_9ACTN|nr:hypothetical protein [Streptomyces sp. YSPA8]GLF93121.1 DUF4280 domain-containing protein [Streptomyces sp. YSPA8]
MSGNVVTSGTAIACPHGGRAVAVPAAWASAAVRVDGRPVLTAGDVLAVSGCPHTVGGVPQPCVSVRWTPEAGGVRSGGSPVVRERTAGLCYSAALVPQGLPVVTAVAGRGVTGR